MTTDKQQRKERPITRGVLDYFPDAIAEVANVSYIGNKQHNGDSEMHWSRGKSADHADCLARHLIERGTMDSDGLRHSAKAAWRALAMLQIEIETDQKLPLAYETPEIIGVGSRPVFGKGPDGENIASLPPTPFIFGEGKPYEKTVAVDTEVRGDHRVIVPQKFFDRPERERDFRDLLQLGCPDQVARQIVLGTTYTAGTLKSGTLTDFIPSESYAYVAGPMRGIPGFNFPAFDAARDRLSKLGFNVISPADIDRHAGDTDHKNLKAADQRDYCFRDFWSLYFLARRGKENAIVLLRNYERSTGATAERALALWLGLKVREVGELVPIEPVPVSDPPEYHRKGGLHYRFNGDRVEYFLDHRWCASQDYPTNSHFVRAIQTGELIPCESLSSATSTNLSATPATSASAKTCGTNTSART